MLAFEVGGVDYITQPFQSEEVLAVIAKAHLPGPTAIRQGTSNKRRAARCFWMKSAN